MANQQTPKKGGQVKDYLAIGITIVSIVGVVALSVTVMLVSEEKSVAANMVLAATFPLLGSWVGTILAYYFSRDNFEAATRNVRAMTQQSLTESGLKNIRVESRMIRKDKIYYKTLPAEQIVLGSVLYDLSRSRRHRLPVFNPDESPAYVIHRSLMDRYLALKAREAQPTDPSQLTLDDLFTDLSTDGPDYQELNEMLHNSFATVGLNASLADAKSAMEALPGCQDVFVTENATAKGKVLGWITNVIITENAKA